MATDGWFIGGGVEHTPESARRLAYAATGGMEGIADSGDLKVVPLSVPGQGVRVLPGSAAIRSRYAGGDTQTYLGAVYQAEQVTVAATGSGGGRSDLVVFVVEDPFVAGSTHPANGVTRPGQVFKIKIISGVPAGTTRLQSVPGQQNTTGIALARIDFPASTGTVTAGMIKDLRKLAKPRQEEDTVIAYPTGAYSSGRAIQPGAYADWPLINNERPLVEIPDWATTILITAIVGGAWYARLGNSNELSVAGTNVAIGGIESEHGIITQSPTDAGNRRDITIIGKVAIPAHMRGTKQRLALRAARSTNTGSWWVDFQSCVSIKWAFSQQAS